MPAAQRVADARGAGFTSRAVCDKVARSAQGAGSRERSWRPSLFLPCHSASRDPLSPGLRDMSAAWGGKSLCFPGHGWSRRSSGSLSFLESLLLRHLPRQQEGPRGPEGDVHFEKAAGPLRARIEVHVCQRGAEAGRTGAATDWKL